MYKSLGDNICTTNFHIKLPLFHSIEHRLITDCTNMTSLTTSVTPLQVPAMLCTIVHTIV